MASSSKNKTTMAKRNRENKVREKQMRKAARKAARKAEAANGTAEPVEVDAQSAEEAEAVKAAEIAAALERLNV
jgi:hypothetical protein